MPRPGEHDRPRRPVLVVLGATTARRRAGGVMSLTLTEETVLRQLYEAVAGTWEDLRHLNIDGEDDRLAFAEHLASVNGSPRLRDEAQLLQVDRGLCRRGGCSVPVSWTWLDAALRDGTDPGP